MRYLIVLGLLVAWTGSTQACNYACGGAAYSAPLAFSYGYAAQLVVPQQVSQIQAAAMGATATYTAPVPQLAVTIPTYAPAIVGGYGYASLSTVSRFAYARNVVAVRERVVVKQVAVRQRVVRVKAAAAPAAAVRVEAAGGARVRVRVR